MGTPILVVRDLRKLYNGFEAVKGVSFTIEKPELVAILGPNGAGKTTLLNMIAGVLPPTSGEILILGKNPWIDRSAKKFIGFVPQELGIRSDMTVYENLITMALIYGLSLGEARKRAKELMDALGLLDHKSKLASKLSGGLKRRLSIAMSLIHDPKVLILDEPTTGLDPGIRLEFIKMLQGFVREGRAVLLSTHISEDAEYCDRVIIMDKGVIVADDTPDVIKLKVIGSKSIVELKTSDLEKTAKVLSNRYNTKVIRNRVNVYLDKPEKQLPLVFSILTDNGIDVYEARIRKPSISDVFLALTGRLLEEEG